MVPNERIFVLPNFAESAAGEEIHSLPAAIEGVLCGHFSVVFAGNLGRQSRPSSIAADDC
jgi:hypothetical protein